MGKINGCLKHVFIFFNSLISIIGGVLFLGAMSLTVYSHRVAGIGMSVFWSWVNAIGVFGISYLGVSAARSENICALKTFAGFMGAGMIIMLISGFCVVASKQVYREVIFPYIYNDFEITIAISFGLSAIALLGLLISLSMIHQIKRHDSSAGQYSMAMNDVQTEAPGPLTSALLEAEPAVKA